MKKKTVCIAAALMAGMMAAGCGGSAAKESESMAVISEAETVETETEEVTEATEAMKETETVKETEMETEAGQDTKETQAKAEAVSQGGGYEDNFAVDKEAIAEFGKKVQAVVADKDLEGLAELTSFPTYVGFEEGGVMPATREEFLELGADRIFTDSLVQSVGAADVNALSPSMAGFSLSEGNGAPNIIFGVVNGELAIQGINY